MPQAFFFTDLGIVMLRDFFPNTLLTPFAKLASFRLMPHPPWHPEILTKRGHEAQILALLFISL
jgi:hypothetical protein